MARSIRRVFAPIGSSSEPHQRKGKRMADYWPVIATAPFLLAPELALRS